MKRYDEYKQTGTPWIGEIPSHWECKQFRYAIKHITTGLNPRNNFVLGEGNNYYVTIRNFENGKLNLDSECDNINDEALKIIHKRSDLKKGDILFASISEEGKAYVLRENPSNWDINESVFSIRPNKELNSDFLFYVLSDNSFYKPLRIGATGTTFSSIKQEQLKGALIAIPPIVEQQLIVEYIDSKIKPIDAVISTQERRIVLLEELKQSVITEAVTHGINPDAKLRPSGIDWIGEIPSHWECKQFRYAIKHITTGLNPRNNFVLGEGNNYYVTIRNFENGKLNLDSECDNINDEALEIIHKRSDLKKGDILFASISEEGKAYVLRENPSNWDINESVFSIRPNKELNSDFLFYVLTDNSFYKPLRIGATGTTFLSIKQEQLKGALIAIPPIDEQQLIVKYIESKIKPIDASIAKAKREIELLKELKQSVITEAVTGKIKVC